MLYKFGLIFADAKTLFTHILNNMNKILTLGLALAATASLHAQSSVYSWGVGVHPTAFSYYALDNGVFKTSEYEPGVSFSILHRLNNYFDGGLELGLGQVRHPDLFADFQSGARARHREDFYNYNLITRFKFDNGKILPLDCIFSPFVKAGIGGSSYKGFADNFQPMVPMGLGFNVRLGKFAAHLTAQSSYNLGLGAPSYLQHSIGLNLNFQERKTRIIEDKMMDRDFDGVADERDECPDIFGPGMSKGCPDTDGDGIKDAADKCPTVAGFANLNGCVDTDRDGIVDMEDNCPTEYGVVARNGCPLNNARPDRDKDGIEDDRDECPDVAGRFTAKGCADADGDGIKDAEDKCPNEYGKPEFGGCPQQKFDQDWLRQSMRDRSKPNTIADANDPNGGRTLRPVAVGSAMNLDNNMPDAEYCIKAMESDLGKVYFQTNIDQPTAVTRQFIEVVAQVMKRCNDVKVTITAHTDADANDDFNQSLSVRRADNVKAILITKGVDASRITVQAAGEKQPIAPNDTPENKQLNRRVEFQLSR